MPCREYGAKSAGGAEPRPYEKQEVPIGGPMWASAPTKNKKHLQAGGQGRPPLQIRNGRRDVGIAPYEIL